MRIGKNQKRIGVIIQYINMATSMAISIFLTPFLIHILGDSDYGVYRIVQSFAAQLSFMTFGISILVTRNVVKYNMLGQKREKENFLATAYIIAVILAILVVIIGGILFLGIDSLFSKSMTEAELFQTKKIFWLFIANLSFTILIDSVVGLVSAHEKFAVRYGALLLKNVLRVIILVVALQIFRNSLVIAIVDLLCSILLFIFYYIYGTFVLKESAKLHSLNLKEIKETMVFSTAILLQTIVNQVNQNLDSVILGAMTNTETVTMYSNALVIFTSFNSITLIVSTVFVPSATRLVVGKASSEELTDFVVKPGRLQCMIGSLILSGFFIFGKEFIRFWVGERYIGAYGVALLLMVSTFIPLVQNMTNSILDAMLKRMGRSIIAISMAIINVAISIVLIKRIGYMGAAIGTALSYIIGNGILMNIYLFKVTKINLRKMYVGILSRIWIVSIICTIAFIPCHYIRYQSVWTLLLMIVLYMIVYCVMMYLFGTKKYEKEYAKNFLHIKLRTEEKI